MSDVILVLISVSFIFLPLSQCSDSLQELLFSANYEFIDLSYTYDNNTVYWPKAQKFEFIRKIEGGLPNTPWYALNDFKTSEHSGTHIDAPYHFYQSGKYVADLPLNWLIVPMIIVDVSSKVEGNPNYVLYKKDLDSDLHTRLEQRFQYLLIFKFGWSQYASDHQRYFGFNGTSLCFPGLSGEVAEWITSLKNVVGVGVDTASMDPGASTDFVVHRILSKAGLYHVENVNFHRQFNEYNCTGLVLPMKIGGGTGAPVRLVAICPKKT